MGAPRLGLFALAWPPLAARCCFHPFGQRAGVAGSDKRSLAAHGDPHAFQGSNKIPRVLGEFGDDPHRYADGKARKNYAATSPITRASGKKKVIAARFIHNDRRTYRVVRSRD